MIKLNEAVVVEGKYDKIRLSGFIDAVIVETDGFRIFSDCEKKNFIKMLAKTKGIIIMTDSDAAGFKIRDYIRKIAGEENVINVYMPDIYGKEKRKTNPSKEGKLGVEGISEDVIMSALHKAGIAAETIEEKRGREVCVTDLYENGFTGSENSKNRKYELLTYLGLPKRLSNSQLLKVINTFMTYDDYVKAVREITDC